MSLDLAVARFDGEGTAVQRYAAAKERAERSGGEASWTQKVGFVERHHNGRLLLRGTFAGHYLDVDESDRVSQKGAGEGAVAGGLIGVLLGPAGIAVGITLGGVIGSKTGDEPETEAEPGALAERLRESLPPSASAIVLVAEQPEVDEMLGALDVDAQDVIRRTLTAEQQTELEQALRMAPPASPGL